MKMQKAIIGKKVGMTQIFDESGKVIPVTVIEAGPCVVTQKKTTEKDGYSAIQLGYEDVKESKLSKPEAGHLKKADVAMKKHLKEFRIEKAEEKNVGDVITVTVVSLMPFGAFAEIMPGVDGLIHNSQISDKMVSNPASVLKVGDKVEVKIIAVDADKNRISLSIRAAADPDYVAPEPPKAKEAPAEKVEEAPAETAAEEAEEAPTEAADEA